MDVGDVCIWPVETSALDETIDAVARQMSERGVGTVVVLDSEGRPEGILTDRDIVVRCVARGRDAAETRVREVVTTPLSSLLQETSLETALEVMAQEGVRRMVVTDARGELMGILSLDDVMGLLTGELARVREVLGRSARPGSGPGPGRP